MTKTIEVEKKKREETISISIFPLLPAMSTPGPASQGVMLRVRRAMDYPELPYQLRYVGYPELGKCIEGRKVNSELVSLLVLMSLLFLMGMDFLYK